MDAGKLAAEPLGDRRQCRVERRVAGDAMRGRRVPGARRMTKNGLPKTAGSAQANSGSGTVTPAANAAFSTANSCSRSRLDGTPVGAVGAQDQTLLAVERAAGEIARRAPQFSWIAPPRSGASPVISQRPRAARRGEEPRQCRAAGRRRRGRRQIAATRVAAIDRDDRAGDIGARRRGQQQHRAVEIVGLRRPGATGSARRASCPASLSQELAVEIGLDIAGRERVDEDAVARQLHRQHMGQMNEPGLGRAIARHPRDRARRQHRGDVDDPSRPPALDQMAGEFARHQPGAFEIGVDDVIPILLGVLEHRLGDDDAGIVDEQGQRPERPLRPRRARRRRCRGGSRRARPAGTSPPSRLDLARSLGETVGAPRGQRHLGPGSGQQQCQMPPDPARRAGDQRHLPGEIEARQRGHRAYCRSAAPLRSGAARQRQRPRAPGARGEARVRGSYGDRHAHLLRALAQHEFLDLAGRGLRQRRRTRPCCGTLKCARWSRHKARISSARSAPASGFSVDEGAGRLAPFRRPAAPRPRPPCTAGWR